MSWSNLHRVGVVGAGLSGVCSAAHLLRQGLEVTVFERSDTVGGVWHFDESVAREPAYPSETPSSEASHPFHQSNHCHCDDLGKLCSGCVQELRLDHAPPGPCYVSLKNNIPISLSKNHLADWPKDLEDYINHSFHEDYIQRIAARNDVIRSIQFSTRVESIEKKDDQWCVRTTTLRPASRNEALIEERIWEFDAIVVASGHYNLPRVPDFPGLKGWKQQFQDRVKHSKTYRDTRGFEQQNVLIVGGGVSAIDIAKDLGKVAQRVYQSTRDGSLDLPATMLPSNAERITSIAEFTLDDAKTSSRELTRQEAIPGSIHLADSAKLTHIHQVILATGYIVSYPFLGNLQSDTVTASEADARILVTKEGEMVHNLHKDIFYVEDPTLAFIGVPYHIVSFALFDFQAQVLARCFSGKVLQPEQAAMRAEYSERVRRKGLGRDFHSLRYDGEEVGYVDEMVEWINQNLSDGSDPIEGYSEEWKRSYDQLRQAFLARFGKTGLLTKQKTEDPS